MRERNNSFEMRKERRLRRGREEEGERESKKEEIFSQEIRISKTPAINYLIQLLLLKSALASSSLSSSSSSSSSIVRDVAKRAIVFH